MSTPRYEVIPSRRWVGPNGRTASIYGAVPYTSDADKADWKVETVGFTIRDNHENTVGLGRKPFTTEAEAQSLADTLNTRREYPRMPVITFTVIP